MKSRAWGWLAASIALEMSAGAAMLAYFRSKARAASEENWRAVVDKPEEPEGTKEDGVPRD